MQERGIESSVIADNRLEVFLHSQPVLYVSPASDVFLLPDGSQNEEASELYHQVAVTADEVLLRPPPAGAGPSEQVGRPGDLRQR